MKKVVFCVVCLLFFGSKNALAHDTSADYYVQGGALTGNITLLGIHNSTSTAAETVYSGILTKLAGGLLFSPSFRLGASYSQSSMTVMDAADPDNSRITVAVPGMYFDYIFSFNFFLGAGSSLISVSYEGRKNLPNFATYSGSVRLGGFWRLDNRLLIDLSYENYLLNNVIANTSYKYESLNAFAMSLGYLF